MTDTFQKIQTFNFRQPIHIIFFSYADASSLYFLNMINMSANRIIYKKNYKLIIDRYLLKKKVKVYTLFFFSILLIKKREHSGTNV
jgi:hypothetical protein